MSPKILILNGPNLNALGRREPAVYGAETLADVEAMCRSAAKQAGFELDFRQSNSESELIGWIQEAGDEIDAVIINAGAYSHTSIAILDALRQLSAPVIEVHLSNIYQRETYRQHSYISAVARGVICGFGPHGYVLAIEAAARLRSAKA